MEHRTGRKDTEEKRQKEKLKDRQEGKKEGKKERKKTDTTSCLKPGRALVAQSPFVSVVLVSVWCHHW